MHLRAELLRAKQDETEVSATLGDVEQHLPDGGVTAIARRILVQLVDEHDEVLDAQIPPLQVLAQLGDDPGEDEVLRIFLEVGDIHHVHRAVLNAPKWKVAYRTRIGDQTSAACGDV